MEAYFPPKSSSMKSLAHRELRAEQWMRLSLAQNHFITSHNNKQ
jgi:hypothetical protein